MIKNNNFYDIQQWMLIITLTIFVIVFTIFVYELIDFHNDYVCSTTTSLEWFNTHNCIKYFNN